MKNKVSFCLFFLVISNLSFAGAIDKISSEILIDQKTKLVLSIPSNNDTVKKSDLDYFKLYESKDKNLTSSNAKLFGLNKINDIKYVVYTKPNNKIEQEKILNNLKENEMKFCNENNGTSDLNIEKEVIQLKAINLEKKVIQYGCQNKQYANLYLIKEYIIGNKAYLLYTVGKFETKLKYNGLALLKQYSEAISIKENK